LTVHTGKKMVLLPYSANTET